MRAEPGLFFSCLFTPTPGFIGDAGFTYQIDDSHGLTVTGTVSIAVVQSGVAFTSGDLFVGVDTVVYRLSRQGVVLDALASPGSFHATGMCFDADGNLFSTQFSSAGNLAKFDNHGVLLNGNWAGTALLGTDPESCVFDAAGNLYVGSADAGAPLKYLHKFDPNGNLVAEWNPPSPGRGLDWIDLAPDQCTLYYASESDVISRFDVCTGTQLDAFATGLPAPCYANRILPDGGVIVACEGAIVRLSSTGEVVRKYHPETANEFYFAMNVDPDGMSFWTIGFYSGIVSQVDLASGDVLDQFQVPPSVPRSEFDGFAVYGERTIAKNHAPVGVADTYGATVNTLMTVPIATGVLANDTDADGDSLTAALDAGPTHGILTLNADGSFGYTPSAAYVGPDSFTYRASDGLATSGVTSVSITVSGTNHAPVGVADTYTTAQDAVLTVPALSGVLANDTDADGNPLTATKIADPQQGTVVLAADGSFVYTPVASYLGPDSFTYNVSDGSTSAGPVAVSISVTSANHPPVGIADSYSGPQDTALTVSATLGVLANDTDADGDALTATKSSDPGHGTVTLAADGSFTYTPSAGYFGPDSFTYNVSDGRVSSGPVTVSLNLQKTNHAPTLAAIINQTIPEMVPFKYTLAGSDTDGDILAYSLTSGPAALTVNPMTGIVDWTPTEAQGPGIYSVTVRVTDPAALFAERSFTITVSEVNRPPVLGAIPDRNVSVGDLVSLTALASDPDLPANKLTYGLVAGPAGATIDPATGAFSWMPGAGNIGTTTITVQVTDDGSPLLSATTTFKVGVSRVQGIPPTITVPAGITVDPTSPNGAVVTFSATANDVVDGILVPVCLPPSGSIFPIGSTVVTCTATNRLLLTASASFVVTVRTPSGVKHEVNDTLTTLLPAVNRDAADHLRYVIHEITDSLANELWAADRRHLNVKRGALVFHEEAEAVEALMEIKSSSARISSAVAAAINALAGDDRVLAATAVHEIALNRREALRNALAAMAKAEFYVSRGRPDKAIGYFEQAWRVAVTAHGGHMR